MLGDVGGLLDALTALGGVAVSIYTIVRGDKLESFLIRSVYKQAGNRKTSDDSLTPTSKDLKSITRRKHRSLK